MCWRWTILAMEMDAFSAGGKHFSAGDERVESAHSNFSHTHTHTAIHQRLPNKPYVKMIATHRYSPSTKTGSFTLSYSPPRTLHPQVIHMQYNGTPLMRAPLQPSQSVLIRGVSLLQGLFYIQKIRSGPHTVSVLQWMFVFRGVCKVGFHCSTLCWTKWSSIRPTW